MKFPESVITKSKSGKLEVRALVSKGKYIMYRYLDPTSGKESNKKQKLLLKSVDGKIKQWFIIPMQKPRSLMIAAELKEPEKKVWNEKTQKEEGLF